MLSHFAARPEPGEHAPYYKRYIDLVADGDVTQTLERQLADALEQLTPLKPEQAHHRYAPGKWSALQVVGHVADTERVFAYRALSFARGDASELPGFDETTWADAAGADALELAAVLEDLACVRRASLSLLRGLTPAAWARRGVANGSATSVRALAWMMAGHERHHRAVLRERYGIG